MRTLPGRVARRSATRAKPERLEVADGDVNAVGVGVGGGEDGTEVGGEKCGSLWA